MSLTHRGIKYRIYPTNGQKEQIARTFGCSRFVYNQMLQASREAYAKGETLCSRNSFNYLLTGLKKAHPWLAEVDSTALTAANDALADAFSNFFSKRAGYPKFRKKKFCGAYTSKRIQNSNNIAIGDHGIKLPKLGMVRAKLHRLPGAGWTVKSATISREADGNYYASILFEFDRPANTYVADRSNAVGLDYASDGLFVDSDGNVGSRHKFYRESQKKLARAQRKLSRKVGSKKGEPKSRNYQKQLARVGKLHRHIANQRLDNLHKRSTEIANQYDVVCVENLNMRSLSNKGFGNGKATLDNGYGMFLSMLEYKLSDRNKYLVKVSKWFPSSQICSCCGTLHPEMKDLRNRVLQCDCGITISRDQNAAANVLREGMRLLQEVA